MCFLRPAAVSPPGNLLLLFLSHFFSPLSWLFSLIEISAIAKLLSEGDPNDCHWLFNHPISSTPPSSKSMRFPTPYSLPAARLSRSSGNMRTNLFSKHSRLIRVYFHIGKLIIFYHFLWYLQ